MPTRLQHIQILRNCMGY